MTPWSMDHRVQHWDVTFGPLSHNTISRSTCRGGDESGCFHRTLRPFSLTKDGTCCPVREGETLLCKSHCIADHVVDLSEAETANHGTPL